MVVRGVERYRIFGMDYFRNIGNYISCLARSDFEISERYSTEKHEYDRIASKTGIYKQKRRVLSDCQRYVQHGDHVVDQFVRFVVFYGVGFYFERRSYVIRSERSHYKFLFLYKYDGIATDRYNNTFN